MTTQLSALEAMNKKLDEMNAKLSAMNGALQTTNAQLMQTREILGSVAGDIDQMSHKILTSKLLF